MKDVQINLECNRELVQYARALEEDVRQELIEAAKSIRSDYERGLVLSAGST